MEIHPKQVVGMEPRGFILDTDFVTTNAVQGAFIGAAISSGTNTTAPTVSTANHPGMVLLRSSTTANSGYQYSTGLTAFRIQGGEQFDVFFATPAAFTNNTVRLGFFDTITSAAPVDAIMLTISSAGSVLGECRSNSASSVTGTLGTLSASTHYHGRITVNADATSVTFDLFAENGTLIGSQAVTTNIPKAAGRETGCGAMGFNAGTTAADIVTLDKIRLWSPGRTVARGAE